MEKMSGIWAASITPFDGSGAIDTIKLLDHCQGLIQQGCSGISLFGTSGEGTSLSASEKMTALEAVLDGGIPARQVVPSTGCCDQETAISIATHAGKLGCRALLVLPPFFYKPVDDDGLFDYFLTIIKRVRSTGHEIPLLLYNFPALTGVSITHALVRRLVNAVPGSIAGVKDSSLNWRNTYSYLSELSDLSIFTGEDRHLRAAIQFGGAGGISGTSNFAPGLHVRNYESKDAATASLELARFIDVFVGMQDAPFLQSCKAMVAVLKEDESWLDVRPPLRKASLETGHKLLEEFRKLKLDL